MVIRELSPPVILLVEDAATLVQVYIKFLRAEQAEVVAVETLSAAREFISARAPTVVLLDINLPDGSGLDLLRDVRSRGLDTAVVVITADGSINGAVEAMRHGADDFLVKPFAPERLSTTLHHVLERRRLARLVETLPPVLDADGFVGGGGFRPAATKTELRSLAAVERLAIENAIALCGGNLTEAAKYLDINVSTIHRKRQSWLAQASRPAPLGHRQETGRSAQRR